MPSARYAPHCGALPCACGVGGVANVMCGTPVFACMQLRCGPGVTRQLAVHRAARTPARGARRAPAGLRPVRPALPPPVGPRRYASPRSGHGPAGGAKDPTRSCACSCVCVSLRVTGWSGDLLVPSVPRPPPCSPRRSLVLTAYSVLALLANRSRLSACGEKSCPCGEFGTRVTSCLSFRSCRTELKRDPIAGYQL